MSLVISALTGHTLSSHARSWRTRQCSGRPLAVRISFRYSQPKATQVCNTGPQALLGAHTQEGLGRSTRLAQDVHKDRPGPLGPEGRGQHSGQTTEQQDIWV